GFGGTIAGGEGNDLIYGGKGDDIIHGDNADGTGAGRDTIFGDSGNDELHGDGGNDTIFGDFGAFRPNDKNDLVPVVQVGGVEGAGKIFGGAGDAKRVGG